MSQGLWDAFCAASASVPDRPALIFPDAQLSFAELRRRAEDYRQHLLGLGLQRHERVLLWVQNSPEMAAALLGIWGAGGIAALIDASSRQAQYVHALELAAPRAVIHDAVAPPPLPGAPLIGAGEVPHGADTPRAPAGRTLPTDPATIVFTSGSTGKPKGVVQSHGNILRGARAVAGYLAVDPHSDRLLCPVPWAFDYGFVQLHFTLLLGLTQVSLAQATPFNVCEAIAAQRPTVFAGLPSLYTYLLRGVSPLARTDLSSVRLLTSSGGTIPSPVLRDLRSAFAPAQLVLNYGLTETYRSCYLDPTLIDSKYPCLGRPIPGADVIVVREDGTLADTGEDGELVHRGDYICLGYWNNPAATALAVRPDPLAQAGSPDRGRALYTGDIGWRDAEGLLHFRGRRDHQLKSMGVRVSPGEVEGLLHESGLVREAAVFGVPHDMLGDEIWAAVSAASGVSEPQKELTAYVRAAMSPYMRPRRWLLKEQLPKTPNGKVDYPALKDEALRQPSARIAS